VTPSDGTLPQEAMETLAQAVLATLKELSKNREAVTASSLGQELGRRPEVAAILESARVSGPRSAQGSEPGAVGSARVETGASTSLPRQAVGEESRTLTARVELLERQREQLLKERDEAETIHARTQGVYKRSLGVMLGMLRSAGNEDLAEPMDGLKALLKEDGDPRLMEEALQRLVDAAVREGVEAKGPARGGGQRGDSDGADLLDLASGESPGRKGLKGWLSSGVRKAGASPALAAHVTHLKSSALALLESCMALGLPDAPDSWQGFRQGMERENRLEQVIPLFEDLLSSVRSWLRDLREERDQMGAIVTEISRSLGAIEESLLASMDHTTRTLEANRTFQDGVMGHVVGMKEALPGSQSLEDLKRVVMTRLDNIGKALEEKRKDDEQVLREANERMTTLQEDLRKLKAEADQIRAVKTILEEEVQTDSLTLIFNRRACEQRMRHEFQRSRRYGGVFSVLLFDVDHFKVVNDRFGHAAGDRCLREIAKLVSPLLRETDLLARYGGEEFVAILPETGRDGAHTVAEKFRSSVERASFMYRDQSIPVTISVGVTQVADTDTRAEEILERADHAMFEAKRAGRNMVIAI
jgi:diguanylate cyclase (GGDEF)-like protein